MLKQLFGNKEIPNSKRVDITHRDIAVRPGLLEIDGQKPAEEPTSVLIDLIRSIPALDNFLYKVFEE